MTEQWTSAMSFPSFSPHNPDGSLPDVADRREHIVEVAIAWQEHSARGGRIGFRSFDKLRAAGSTDAVESVNRVVELHGLMGSIGEQLSLAYAAEQDAQRWLASPVVGDPDDPEQVRVGQEHKRMAVRGLCEMSTHFALAAAHSLANTVLRVVLLDPAAAAVVNSSKAGKEGKGFLPGADGPGAWRTFSPTALFWSSVLDEAAKAAGSPQQMSALVTCLIKLQQDHRFVSLDRRRGMDYHRHRPQSLSHTSPREGIASRTDATVTVSYVSASDDTANDEKQVHHVAVDALAMLADAMQELSPLIADAARSCHVDW
ncbi:hypothetical protein ACFC6L_34935 [Kitasatospora phosalacinea]|uniref:hypothetical protein n=1 Tax=Kitasatospora phosalacinea TaxID=2065 RepID=UPI0035DA568C